MAFSEYNNEPSTEFSRIFQPIAMRTILFLLSKQSDWLKKFMRVQHSWLGISETMWWLAHKWQYKKPCKTWMKFKKLIQKNISTYCVTMRKKFKHGVRKHIWNQIQKSLNTGEIQVSFILHYHKFLGVKIEDHLVFHGDKTNEVCNL